MYCFYEEKTDFDQSSRAERVNNSFVSSINQIKSLIFLGKLCIKIFPLEIKFEIFHLSVVNLVIK